ncbi:hypothetical protein TrRE_jg11439 [Triparma retinervis]|uniref:Enoyl-CoA delta isomerase 1, mitochondrial n=1 Tax=Triparma retinervis TaxID=2557542 RepID=A0A9W7L590_9STRA|nr:hypothetical protein TrRE_jg11439 [Triparma retinervis]
MFASRGLLRSSRRLVGGISSATRTYVNLSKPSTSVAVLELDRAPVNSLSKEMADAVSAAIKEAEGDDKVQALVLKSSNPKIFSAGLDITEMNNPEVERLEDFWRSIQDLFLTLYGSRLSTVAAIEGHSPAGGCLLAMSCDYRVMTEGENFKIGLNETKLGIAAPYWLKDLFVKTIGNREAELGLGLGKLYSPSEALSVNLIDEVVKNEDVLEVAMKEAETWAKIPPKGRVASKVMLRSEMMDELREKKELDVGWFRDFIMEEGTQKGIDAYLKSLGGKK